MNANPAIPSPAVVPPAFTLNDLRMQSSVREPSSNPLLKLAGAMVVVLAIGAFIWFDPLSWSTPTGATPPAGAVGSSAEPALPAESPEIIAPLTPAPVT